MQGAAATRSLLHSSGLVREYRHASMRLLETPASADIRLKEPYGHQLCLLSVSSLFLLSSVGLIVTAIAASLTDDTAKPETDHEGNPCPSSNVDDDDFPAECREPFRWWTQLMNPIIQMTVWGTIFLVMLPCYARRLRIAGGAVGIGIGITAKPHPDAIAELNRRAAERANGSQETGGCVCCRRPAPQPGQSADPDYMQLPPHYTPDPVLPIVGDEHSAPGGANGILCSNLPCIGSMLRCGPQWHTIRTSVVIRARPATMEDMQESNANGCCSGGPSSGRCCGGQRTACTVGRVSFCCGGTFTNCCACARSDPEDHVVLETRPILMVHYHKKKSYPLSLEEIAQLAGPASSYAETLRKHQSGELVAPTCCGCQCNPRIRTHMIFTPHEDEGGPASVAQKINEALERENKAWPSGVGGSRSSQGAAAPQAPAGFGVAAAPGDVRGAGRGVVIGKGPTL